MKIFLLSMLLLTFSEMSFAQSPYYTLIGETTTQLKQEFGEPTTISKKNNLGEILYSYKSTIGYNGFFIYNGRVITAHMATYWGTRGQANKAFEECLKMYKNDGLKVVKKSGKSAICSNNQYSITVEMSYQNGRYSIIENAIPKI